MQNPLKVDFFGGEKGETLAQIVAVLVTEHAKSAGTRAVRLFFTVFENEFYKFQIFLHFCYIDVNSQLNITSAMANRKLSAYTTEEMQALEKLASKKYGVSTDEMMRHAGKSLHDFVVDELPAVKRILVMAGKGNNGGDALVAGKLLKKSGCEVTVVHADESFPPDFDFSRFDLIIDGLFGFSLKGNPRPPIDRIIEQINCSNVPVLSVDVPSGLEVYSGKIMEPTIRATYTLTLGMSKKGLADSPGYAGKVYLGSVGIPASAYSERGIEPPDFGAKTYVALL